MAENTTRDGGRPVPPAARDNDRPAAPAGFAPAGSPRPADAPVPPAVADAPVPPRPRDIGAGEQVQSPLDALRSVAYADGDINVAAVSDIAPGPHRCSPLGIAVQLAKVLLVLVIVGVSMVVSLVMEGPDDEGPLIFAITAATIAGCLVISVASVVVSWAMRTWELADDGLVLRSGLFVRKQRRIPYQRVHSVDLSASVLERILGLASLKVDTGAGETGEGNAVRSLRRSEAEALKRALFAGRVLVDKRAAAEEGVGATASSAELVDAALAADPAADVAFELELPNALYVRAALTDFNMGAALVSVVAAFASALQLAGDVLGVLMLDRLEDLVDAAVEDAVDAVLHVDALTLLPAVVAGFLAFVLVLLVLTWVISSVVAFVRWGGFVVRRRGDRIEVTAGLLSRSTRAVELGRVQSVSIDQTPVRRAMGYVQIAVRTVGSASSSGSSDAAARERVVVHPCIKRCDAPAFIAQVLPEFAEVAAAPVEGLGLHRLPGAALRRTLLHGLYWTLLFAAPAALGTWALLDAVSAGPALDALALLAVDVVWVALVFCAAVMFVVRVLAWRIRRIGTVGSTLVLVDGGVYRKVSYLTRAKVQSLSRRCTPFQVQAGVATVSARTACVSAEPDPKMRDLAAADAAELMAWVRPHYDNAAQADEALRAAGVL